MSDANTKDRAPLTLTRNSRPADALDIASELLERIARAQSVHALFILPNRAVVMMATRGKRYEFHASHYSRSIVGVYTHDADVRDVVDDILALSAERA